MRLFSALILLWISSSALAQSEDSSIGASAGVRQEKPYGVGVGLGGFVIPIGGGGIMFHYNLDARMQVSAAFMSGHEDATDLLDNTETLYLDQFDVNTQMNQLDFRFFPSNNFYFGLGIAMRKIEFELEAHNGAARIDESLKASSFVARVAVGNIWSFDNGFYIGGEWIAAAIPISSSVSTDITADGTASSDINDLEIDALDLVDKLAKATTFGLAVLQVGWQF